MQQRPILYNIDTYRSTKQILEELRVASSQAIEDSNVAHMAVIFAVLLIKISEEQAYSTRKIIRLQSALIYNALPCQTRLQSLSKWAAADCNMS